MGVRCCIWSFAQLAGPLRVLGRLASWTICCLYRLLVLMRTSGTDMKIETFFFSRKCVQRSNCATYLGICLENCFARLLPMR
jgi:hypothetical protein